MKQPSAGTTASEGTAISNEALTTHVDRARQTVTVLSDAGVTVCERGSII